MLNFIDAEEGGTKSGKRLVTALVGGKVPSSVGDRVGSFVGSLGTWVDAGVGASTTAASSITPDGDPV